MPSIKVHERENIDKALRRFKRLVDKCGTMNDLRDREFFVKPSMVKKRNHASAVKRQQRISDEAKGIIHPSKKKRMVKKESSNQ